MGKYVHKRLTDEQVKMIPGGSEASGEQWPIGVIGKAFPSGGD